jgi:hypothetical protein
MPTYRVLEKSFINDAIREEGEIVEYNGRPSGNLELVDGSDDEQTKPSKRKWEKKSQATEEQNEVEGSV